MYYGTMDSAAGLYSTIVSLALLMLEYINGKTDQKALPKHVYTQVWGFSPDISNTCLRSYCQFQNTLSGDNV
jgi:hypothetical protein